MNTIKLNPSSFQSVTATSSTASLQKMEQTIHKLVNAYRVSQGKKPLIFDEKIAMQARIHSKNMAKGVVPFSHDGFQDRINNIQKSIKLKGAAENVAMNLNMKDPIDTAVKGWIKSPGHQVNMVGDYNKAGVGIAQNAQGEYYFTQIFVKA